MVLIIRFLSDHLINHRNILFSHPDSRLELLTMWDLGAKCWASAPVANYDEHFVSQTANAPDERGEKTVPIENTFSQSDDSSELDGSVQNGVREVEAVTSAWDTKSLILVFFLYASSSSMMHTSS